MSPADQLLRPKVIVAMPAYNEEKYVGSIVLQSRQYADMVIVVDDGSTDRTTKVALLAEASVVRHEKNRGYGSAIQSIFAEAKRYNPDVLVIIDADSQHNPDEIPSLIKPISEGVDVVIGSRVARTGDIPALRRVGQRVLAYFTNVLSRGRVRDTESGFRAYSRKAIEALEPREKGMAISAEIISLATAKGLKITEIPISVSYTKDSSTLNPLRHGWGVLNRIMVMISERRPLLFFGVAGGIFILLGIWAGVTVVRAYYASYAFAVGPALICMLLITIGLLTLFTGLILSVLSKRITDSIAQFQQIEREEVDAQGQLSKDNQRLRPH